MFVRLAPNFPQPNSMLPQNQFLHMISGEFFVCLPHFQVSKKKGCRVQRALTTSIKMPQQSNCEEADSRTGMRSILLEVNATKDTLGGAASLIKIDAGIVGQAVVEARTSLLVMHRCGVGTAARLLTVCFADQGVSGSTAKLRDGDFNGAGCLSKNCELQECFDAMSLGLVSCASSLYGCIVIFR